jgi:hypothetical protein
MLRPLCQGNILVWYCPPNPKVFIVLYFLCCCFIKNFKQKDIPKNGCSDIANTLDLDVIEVVSVCELSVNKKNMVKRANLHNSTYYWILLSNKKPKFNLQAMDITSNYKRMGTNSWLLHNLTNEPEAMVAIEIPGNTETAQSTVKPLYNYQRVKYLFVCTNVYL